MQRASSSRRRLNSTDSNRSTGTSTTSGSIRNLRSRSQERSVGGDSNGYHGEEEAYYSQQESTSSEEEEEAEAEEGRVHETQEGCAEDVFQDALERPEEDSNDDEAEKTAVNVDLALNMNGHHHHQHHNDKGSPGVKIVGVVNHKDRVIITGASNSSDATSSQSTSASSSITSHSHSTGGADRIYRRSASDPFDLSAVEEDSSCETSTEFGPTQPQPQPPLAETNTTTEQKKYKLPTLPRYPVAETRDMNCWSEPSVDVFRVRGKDYLSNKKKVPSDPYLLRARGCDLLLFPKENSKREPASLMERTSSVLNGTLHKEPSLVLNFRFPWGLMVLYFEIPDHLAKYLQHVPQDQRYTGNGDVNRKKEQSTTDRPSLDHLSPGDKTLAKWIMGSTDYKNQRLKLIPIVVEGPWVVRNLVTGKPAIIGTKLPVQYHCTYPTTSSSTQQYRNPLLCVELDIGNSSNTAKRIVSLCRRYMNALTVDIGFVIQGNNAEELPEQMLGSIRIHGVDPLKAPTFI